ncbi:hypothetical protein [Caballeronia sp.]|uniref:hypothetical protein n=1 Tax=Caballeronia sp. TaxID=1931223 RepID=UPI003C6F0AA2
MTTELTRYNGYRYVLRKARSVTDDVEKIKAGHAMLMHADMYVWESNAALVARVESFLLKEFSWYSRLAKSARETLQMLLTYVRDGAVIVLEENGATTSAFENGGFTLDPPAQEARRYAPPLDYAARAAANAASLLEYNDAIDARIERERLLNTPSFEDTIPLDMPFLLSVVGMVWRGMNLERQAEQKIASGFNELADNMTTPLGDAAPFEYIKSAASEFSDTVAGVFLTPSEEAECMFQYNADMIECAAWYAAKPSSWGMCKQRAADRLGRCVAGKGEVF